MRFINLNKNRNFAERAQGRTKSNRVQGRLQSLGHCAWKDRAGNVKATRSAWKHGLERI